MARCSRAQWLRISTFHRVISWLKMPYRASSVRRTLPSRLRDLIHAKGYQLWTAGEAAIRIQKRRVPWLKISWAGGKYKSIQLPVLAAKILYQQTLWLTIWSILLSQCQLPKVVILQACRVKAKCLMLQAVPRSSRPLFSNIRTPKKRALCSRS